MLRYILSNFFLISTLTAAEFFAGLTIPKEHSATENLFGAAIQANKHNPTLLAEIEALDSEWLGLLAIQDKNELWDILYRSLKSRLSQLSKPDAKI